MDNDIFGKMKRNLQDNLAKPNLVKEISELRKRMATLREDNRKLRHELFQKSVKSDPLKKQDESLYFLLQEFMVENNSLRVANKELKEKALKESKVSMRKDSETHFPDIVPSSRDRPPPVSRDSKVPEMPPAENSRQSSGRTSKLSTRTTFSTVSTQTNPISRRSKKISSSSGYGKSSESSMRASKRVGYADLYNRRKIFQVSSSQESVFEAPSIEQTPVSYTKEPSKESLTYRNRKPQQPKKARKTTRPELPRMRF